MMKLSRLFENFDLARLALSHYRHDEGRLTESLSWYRISSNAVYPFFRDQRICFLRMAPTDEKSTESLEADIGFIEYLREQGYPAMELIPTETGEKWLKLDTEWGEYAASAYWGVPGVQLEELEPSDKLMKAYGRALAELHNLSERCRLVCEKPTHAEMLEQIEERLRLYQAPSFLLTECARVKEALSALPRDASVYGLIHYDFEPDNVFYQPETEKISVIDFDDSLRCWYAADIEQVLDALADVAQGEKLQEARRAFLRGYRELRAVEEAWLPLMRRFINLRSYADILRSLSETFDNEPEWMVGLRRKLSARLRELEEGVRGGRL